MSNNNNSKKVIELIDDEYTEEYLSKISVRAKEKVKRRTQQLKTGLHVQSPVICPGFEKCIWNSHCPLNEVSIDGEIIEGDRRDYPIGRSCVLEREYQKDKIIEYYNQLEADPDNPVEAGLVNDLALIDLLKNRALMILSAGDRNKQGQDFMLRDITGAIATDNGIAQKFYSTQVHPAYTIIESLEKRRAQLLDKAMQTREARFKIQSKQGNQQQESKLIYELMQIRNLLTKDQPKFALAEEEIKII